VPNLQLSNNKALCNVSRQCYCLSRASRYGLCWSFWPLSKCQEAETISEVWVPIPIDSIITGMMDSRDDRLKWTQNQGKAWYSAHRKSFSFTRLRSHWRQNSCLFKQSGILPTLPGSCVSRSTDLIISFKSVNYQNILYLFPMIIW